MAKNTHAQEVSTGDSASFTDHELSDVDVPENVQRVITRMNLGGEPPSSRETGTDSSARSGSAKPSNAKLTPSHPKPAPTTEPPLNPSGGSPTDDGAPLTDGSTPETGTESDELPVIETAEQDLALQEEIDSSEDSPPEETRPKPSNRKRTTTRKPAPATKDTRTANVRSTDEDLFEI